MTRRDMSAFEQRMRLEAAGEVEAARKRRADLERRIAQMQAEVAAEAEREREAQTVLDVFQQVASNGRAPRRRAAPKRARRARA